MQFVGVDFDKLSTMLRTAAASTDMVALYPDVLVFEGFPASWPGLPESVQRVAKECFVPEKRTVSYLVAPKQALAGGGQ